MWISSMYLIMDPAAFQPVEGTLYFVVECCDRWMFGEVDPVASVQ